MNAKVKVMFYSPRGQDKTDFRQTVKDLLVTCPTYKFIMEGEARGHEFMIVERIDDGKNETNESGPCKTGPATT